MTQEMNSKQERRFIVPMLVVFVLITLVGGFAYWRAQRTNASPTTPAIGAAPSDPTKQP